jgi:hypothetical protein
MNRATRDKFATVTSADPTVGNALWETAPKVFEKLNEDFGPFDVDLTANADNHLLPDWFGPGSPWLNDALRGDWGMRGTKGPDGGWDGVLRFTSGYSNPAYGLFVSRILPVAIAEAHKGFSSTFLLRLAMNRNFFRSIWPHASSIYLCDKRLVFFENGQPRMSQDKRGKWHVCSAMFDSLIVRFTPNGQSRLGPSVNVWKVPPHA